MAEILIDAEAFEEELENFSAKEINLIFDNPHDKMIARHTVSEVTYLLEKIPTIEAKSIIHAHWEPENYYYRCSNCGETTFWDLDEDSSYAYCPWCGAQMNEVTE